MRVDNHAILHVHPAHETLKHATNLAAAAGRAVRSKEAHPPGSVSEQVARYRALLPQDVEAPDRLAQLAKKVAQGELLTRQVAEQTAEAIRARLFRS